MLRHIVGFLVDRLTDGIGAALRTFPKMMGNAERHRKPADGSGGDAGSSLPNRI
jgi:hypothetical protein